MTASNRASSLLLLCAAGLLGAFAAATVPRALAQDDPQPAAEAGRYQISTIPGAVYLVDTRTADVWVRDYTTKTWRTAGNPLAK